MGPTPYFLDGIACTGKTTLTNHFNSLAWSGKNAISCIKDSVDFSSYVGCTDPDNYPYYCFISPDLAEKLKEKHGNASLECQYVQIHESRIRKRLQIAAEHNVSTVFFDRNPFSNQIYMLVNDFITGETNDIASAIAELQAVLSCDELGVSRDKWVINFENQEIREIYQDKVRRLYGTVLDLGRLLDIVEADEACCDIDRYYKTRMENTLVSFVDVFSGFAPRYITRIQNRMLKDERRYHCDDLFVERFEKKVMQLLPGSDIEPFTVSLITNLLSYTGIQSFLFSEFVKLHKYMKVGVQGYMCTGIVEDDVRDMYQKICFLTNKQK